jgi:hypothetical protein
MAETLATPSGIPTFTHKVGIGPLGRWLVEWQEECIGALDAIGYPREFVELAVDDVLYYLEWDQPINGRPDWPGRTSTLDRHASDRPAMFRFRSHGHLVSDNADLSFLRDDIGILLMLCVKARYALICAAYRDDNLGPTLLAQYMLEIGARVQKIWGGNLFAVEESHGRTSIVTRAIGRAYERLSAGLYDAIECAAAANDADPAWEEDSQRVSGGTIDSGGAWMHDSIGSVLNIRASIKRSKREASNPTHSGNRKQRATTARKTLAGDEAGREEPMKDEVLRYIQAHPYLIPGYRVTVQSGKVHAWHMSDLSPACEPVLISNVSTYLRRVKKTIRSGR